MKGRDKYGRPTERVDEVPVRPKKEKQECLSQLVDMLQQANKREEDLKESVKFWERKYHSLYQEHLTYIVRGLSNETRQRCERWLLRNVQRVHGKDQNHSGFETRVVGRRLTNQILDRLLRNGLESSVRISRHQIESVVDG